MIASDCVSWHHDQSPELSQRSQLACWCHQQCWRVLLSSSPVVVQTFSCAEILLCSLGPKSVGVASTRLWAGEVQCPMPVSDNAILTVYCMQEVCRQVDSFMQMLHGASAASGVFDLSLVEGEFIIPTLNGWLLGYPVVYLVTSGTVEGTADYLSLQDLQRHVLKASCPGLKVRLSAVHGPIRFVSRNSALGDGRQVSSQYLACLPGRYCHSCDAVCARLASSRAAYWQV